MKGRRNEVRGIREGRREGRKEGKKEGKRQKGGKKRKGRWKGTREQRRKGGKIIYIITVMVCIVCYILCTCIFSTLCHNYAIFSFRDRL